MQSKPIINKYCQSDVSSKENLQISLSKERHCTMWSVYNKIQYFITNTMFTIDQLHAILKCLNDVNSLTSDTFN